MAAPDAQLPPQPWITERATRAVVEALRAEGAEVRFVGGCVRDSVAGRPVRDIDIATVDPPEKVLALLAAAGLKGVPTGIKHGTVTAVAHHRPFEVTTLRRDVETHGRHATVAFTDDWQADAARRDFTFNALSLSPELSFTEYVGRLDQIDGLRAIVKKQVNPGTPAETASTMEFVLEALHQNSLVGKDQLSDAATTYNDIMGSMLSSLGPIDDDDDDLDEDDFYRRYR